MTTFAKTAKPANAAIAWATKDSIFVEIPSKVGPPYIARYKKTVQGLTAALNILIEHPQPASPKPSPLPTILRPAKPGKPTVNASDATRQAAAEAVRKLLKP